MHTDVLESKCRVIILTTVAYIHSVSL